MAITPLKIMFGDKLRKHLSNASLRQRDLAEAMKISCSAVSQMISGKIVPGHAHITTICQTLKLDRNQSTELISMLVRIRNGERELRSRFNQMLFATRCERGISMEELSSLTGIPAYRLALLETACEVQPTIEEINKLSPALACRPEEMLVCAGMVRPRITGSAISVSDVAEDFQCSQQGLPMLYLEQLAEFKVSKESIFGFAAHAAHRQTRVGTHLSVPAVAVNCRARDLNLGTEGEVILVVSNERPAGYRELELCMDSHGSFFIRERNRNSWWQYNFTSIRKKHIEYGNSVMALPILDLTFRPVRSRGGAECEDN